MRRRGRIPPPLKVPTHTSPPTPSPPSTSTFTSPCPRAHYCCSAVAASCPLSTRVHCPPVHPWRTQGHGVGEKGGRVVGAGEGEEEGWGIFSRTSTGHPSYNPLSSHLPSQPLPPWPPPYSHPIQASLCYGLWGVRNPPLPPPPWEALPPSPWYPYPYSCEPTQGDGGVVCPWKLC